MAGGSAQGPRKLLAALNAGVRLRGLEVRRDVAFGARPDQRLDICRPEGAAKWPVLVFFYGGAWRGGRRALYRFLAARLARAGCVVIVPDYRLFPAVTYPDFLRDCAAATAWAANNAASLGSNGDLFLMGHSAGAYNAVMLGLDPRWLREAGMGTYRVSGVIGISGPYDFLPITDPRTAAIFPGAGPESQPIRHASADAPPLLLITGDADRRVKPRHSAALAARVRDVGGRAETLTYPGLGHLAPVLALAPMCGWRAPVLRDVMGFMGAAASLAGPAVSKPAALLPPTRP